MAPQDLQPGSAIPCLPSSPAIPMLLGASPAQPLPSALLDDMQDLFQADFSDVLIHIFPHASRLGMAAVAFGEDLYFAPGHYAPDTSYGRFVLAHELQHVMQQRQARVLVPANPLALVEDPLLEAEADHMGLLAARMPLRKSRSRESRRCASHRSIATLSSRCRVLQPLRIGKIPPVGFQPNPLGQAVGPRFVYAQLSALNPQPALAVANFTDAVRTEIHYGNFLYYNHYGHYPKAPLVPANLQASDESGQRLWLTRCFTHREVEVDHIVPKTDYGCNHYLNARVLSNYQNRPSNGATSRPAQFEIMCLEDKNNVANVNGLNFTMGSILNLAQLNLLLQIAFLLNLPYAPDHNYNQPLPNLGAFTDNDFRAISFNPL